MMKNKFMNINNINNNMLHKKLLYKSIHRGCKEMDIILGNFAQKHLQNFNIDELYTYEILLQINDVYIYDMLLGNIKFNDLVFENNQIYETNIDIVNKLLSLIRNSFNSLTNPLERV